MKKPRGNAYAKTSRRRNIGSAKEQERREETVAAPILMALAISHEMNRGSLRLGMSGTATAFAANAGGIGLLASIPVWVSAYAAYL